MSRYKPYNDGKWRIVDWAYNEMFDCIAFDTFEEAADYLYEQMPQEYIDDDNEAEEWLGEFEIVSEEYQEPETEEEARVRLWREYWGA